MDAKVMFRLKPLFSVQDIYVSGVGDAARQHNLKNATTLKTATYYLDLCRRPGGCWWAKRWDERQFSVIIFSRF